MPSSPSTFDPGDPAFVRIVHKGHLRRPVRDLRLIDYERHILEYALR